MGVHGIFIINLHVDPYLLKQYIIENSHYDSTFMGYMELKNVDLLTSGPYKGEKGITKYTMHVLVMPLPSNHAWTT